MTRPLRVQFPGAVYHVMGRGNVKQEIYIDDIDRRAFLKILKGALELHNVVCHAYCFMSNHYHVLLETPEGNLARAMRDIHGGYARYFNARHNRVGHLFEGRYKSILVEKESYLLELARYIVLNPVRAKLVRHPWRWEWSSYNATMGTARRPKWLTTSFILNHFSADANTARAKYFEFVAAGAFARDPHENLEHNFILGSPQFVHSVWEGSTWSKEGEKSYPRGDRYVGRPPLSDVFCKVTSVAERNRAIRFARERCGYLISEIARQVKLDPSTVGKIVKDQEK